jgi:DNA polymerase-3 subunit beta
MKLKLKTADLKLWMGRLTKMTRGGNALPVLDTVRLEADEEGHLSLDFTNLDIWMKASLRAEVSSGGCALVNAKKLNEAAKLLPDAEVSVELSARGLKVSGRSASYTFATLPVEEFPAEPATVVEAGALKVEAAGQFLAGMIKGVQCSICSDSSRYLLESLKLEVEGSVVRLVATDGKRLSVYERDLQGLAESSLAQGEEEGPVIPADAVPILCDLCTEAGIEVVRLFADHRALDFWWGDAWLRVKLVDGKYPNYKAVIPDFSKRPGVVISPDEWDDAISSVLAVAVTGRDRQPRLVISKDRFSLEEPEVGSAWFEVAETSVEQVVVNAEFLQEAIRSVPTAKAVFYPGEAGDPVVLTLPDHFPKNPIRWLHVLMPMRTAGN